MTVVPGSVRRVIIAVCSALLSFTHSAARADSSGTPSIDAAERLHLLDAVFDNLHRYYFDPAVAKKTADALRSHERKGEYATRNGPEFAALLTKHLREASQDMHLEVVYSSDPIPLRRSPPSAGDLARFRRELEQSNCTIVKAEILPNNIGYFKFNFFSDPQICSGRFAAAMSSLDQADAIIFDLRENRGGFPETVLLVASYLFDHPEYLFNPREAPSQNSWTRSPVPGSHLAHKRVYILTSATTLSGAEQFCYNMKMLKRATLIGETTGGAAHAGVFHRIDDHFGMGIPEVRTINPYSSRDWEGTGVEPDVKVRAADALETATRIATSELRK